MRWCRSRLWFWRSATRQHPELQLSRHLDPRHPRHPLATALHAATPCFCVSSLSATLQHATARSNASFGAACSDCNLPRPSRTVLLVQTGNLPLCCPFQQRRATCGESPMGRRCHIKISRRPRRPRGEPLDHRCQMRAAPAARCEPYRRQPRPSPHPRRMPHLRRRWHIASRARVFRSRHAR